MTQNNELYDHLLAARIVYQDTFENEIDIIKELKIYLIESGFASEEINETLYNFYQHINIPIILQTIEEVSFNSDPTINTIVEFIFNSPNNNFINSINTNIQQNDQENDQENDQQNDQENNLQLNSEINNSNIINILNTIVTNLNNNNNMFIQINDIQTQEFQDVVLTVNNTDLEKLNSEILTENHDNSCSICMSPMIKDEKITILNCNHVFHYECIIPYLKDFNYKCPMCRSEVGKPNYNI